MTIERIFDPNENMTLEGILKPLIYDKITLSYRSYLESLKLDINSFNLDKEGEVTC